MILLLKSINIKKLKSWEWLVEEVDVSVITMKAANVVKLSTCHCGVQEVPLFITNRSPLVMETEL